MRNDALLHNTDGKVYFIWVLVRETGSLQDEMVLTLLAVHYRSSTRKQTSKSSCNV